MSSSTLKKIYFSKNSNKYLSNNTKNTTKSSKENLERQKKKKININKFLTRALCFEHKKNLDIEKKRFKKILKEQNDLIQKPYSTGRSIRKSKISKKNPFFKKAIESMSIKKKKFLDAKRNNTIEGTKLNNISKEELKNKYKKNDLYINKMNKFYSDQKVNEKQKEKKMNDNVHQDISKKKRNYINKKAKYNHEEILYGLYKQNELMDFKKTYLKNKYSYEFKPILNYNNKYRRISAKYDKIKNNNNKKKENICYSSRNKKPLNIINNSIINDCNNDLNNSTKISQKNNTIENLNLNKKNLKKNKKTKKKTNLNKSEEDIKHWITLFSAINNNDNKDSLDNTYYINVNESMPWNENSVNNILYKSNLKDILYKFVELK